MIPSRSLALLAARSSSSRALRLWPFGLHIVRRRTDYGGLMLSCQAGQRAWETTTAAPLGGVDAEGAKQDLSPSEEQESGRFDVKPNESILFFDNLFPLRLSPLLSRRTETDQQLTDLLKRFNSSSLGIMDPIQLVKRAIPENLPIKVTEILPRLKDGGAFVKFEYDAGLDASDIEAKLLQRLREEPVKPWFNPFRRIRARLVRGVPWLEDLHRYPSPTLMVEFVPPEPGAAAEELPEEVLYSLFRRYGKIADIVSQPADSKITPRYAQIGFPLLRDTIMARNCLHGFVLGEAQGGGKNGTKLRLSYVKREKGHSIWNWLTSHPRIVIPVVAALIAGVSVMIFDPIRMFFIKVNVQHSLRYTDWRIYKWFKSRTGTFSFYKKEEHVEGLGTIWKHRKDLIEQLRSWLDGSSDTFIVVTGPRGSGKAEMVMSQALGGRKNVLLIDCKPITEASGEAGTIKRLAAAVGYRPVFSWANSISSMIDLAVQSTTGVKSGFSETLESQLNKILHTTATALKRVALSDRHKTDKDAGLSEDAYLEAHPEQRPIIVVDNFLHRNEGSGIVYDMVAEWAATVVQNNVAHVVFLTSDSAYSKSLTKAMPDRVFRTLSLGDLDADVAKNFVVTRVEQDLKRETQEEEADQGAEGKKPSRWPNMAGLDEGIKVLGGRLTDLEFLARRLKAGQTPHEAVEEIVTEDATDIVKMYLLGRTADADRRWSTEQAWHLIKALAESPTLRYHQVLLSPTFASSLSANAANGEAAIESLADAELITVKTHRGRPQTITAGKALHQAAFGMLVRDRVLRAKMDLAVLNEMAKAEAKNIDAVEKELQLLGGLPRHTGESAGRVMYLLSKLDAGQVKIAQMEREMAGLKKILHDEY
ncbi:mitochondrial escape 2 [Trichoderma cornu-damae]|uniref:Mitochondrial escape protein 2 n=1 Tax=Trichoderma cornu-damae TaxID=654480 RepID=A0A9P8TU18_9HYPO|nr:mitochondrial escape 2 [Trichoderma cornu-damae]